MLQRFFVINLRAKRDIAMRELFQSNTDSIIFTSQRMERFRGDRIPGAKLYTASHPAYAISIQDFQAPQYQFSLLNFKSATGQFFTIKESTKHLRFEMVCEGEMWVREPSGAQFCIKAGEYRITDAPIFHLEVRPARRCAYFTAILTPSLLAELGTGETIARSGPLPLPIAIRDNIDRVINSPFEPVFRHSLYDMIVREIAWEHVFQLAVAGSSPTCINESDLAKAGGMSLTEQSIRELAGNANVTVQLMHDIIQTLFGDQSTGSILTKRLENARQELQSTDTDLRHVAINAGYESITEFIIAFRDRYDLSPMQYRNSLSASV